MVLERVVDVTRSLIVVNVNRIRSSLEYIPHPSVGLKTDEVSGLGGTQTTSSGGAKIIGSGGTEAISLGGRPKAERLPAVNNTTEIEDGEKLNIEECNSTSPSLKMSTSLEEVLTDPDLYMVVLEELLEFCLKNDHCRYLSQLCCFVD